MILLANESRSTPADIFNYEDWNILSAYRRKAWGLSSEMMDEDKITSYLGDSDDE
jgi:hypothetical protein